MSDTRKLASIQQITSIHAIPDADNIEVAQVLGWKTVVRKGEFEIGDAVVYVEIDSIMPDKPEFEFLKDSKGNMKPVRTRKMRGQVSQGVVFPLTILPSSAVERYEGADVTEILGVTKYEPPVSEELTGHQRNPRYVYKYSWLPNIFYDIMRKVLSYGKFRDRFMVAHGIGFPPFLTKSDETRVQVLQDLINKYENRECYYTEKLDGSSITIYLKDGEFGVCSRNVDLKEEVGNKFWDTVRNMNIEYKMRQYVKFNTSIASIALQGEIIGKGIQENKYGLNDTTIRFYNVFDIDRQKYLDFSDFKTVISDLGLQTVPIIDNNYKLSNNIDEIIEMSKGNSKLYPLIKDMPREGIVIRPVKEIQDEYFGDRLVRNRVSFKAINQDFLLKYKE